MERLSDEERSLTGGSAGWQLSLCLTLAILITQNLKRNADSLETVDKSISNRLVDRQRMGLMPGVANVLNAYQPIIRGDGFFHTCTTNPSVEMDKEYTLTF